MYGWTDLSRAWSLVRTRAERLMKSSDNWMEADSPTTYTTMVGTFKEHGCADDRDRVYALLSLAEKDKPLKVSYTLSVAAVYTEFYAVSRP
jgi:hypothetical protein